MEKEARLEACIWSAATAVIRNVKRYLIYKAKAYNATVVHPPTKSEIYRERERESDAKSVKVVQVTNSRIKIIRVPSLIDKKIFSVNKFCKYILYVLYKYLCKCVCKTNLKKCHLTFFLFQIKLYFLMLTVVDRINLLF